MATYYERQKILREEFRIIDINQNHELTKVELLTALDRKLGHAFDRDVADQLWGQAAEQNVQTVSVDKFINVLIQAEDVLKNKLSICRAQLEDSLRQKRDAEGKLRELQGSENLNIYGVMQGSQISVQVLEGSNFRFSDFSHTLDPFVIVKLDRKESQTALGRGPNPVWEDKQIFYFDVQTGREDLVISVCDFDKFTSNVVIGRVNINLTNNNLGIKDQNKHDIWLELFEPNGNQTGGQLRVTLQWIFSRVRYLNDVLNIYNNQVNEQQEELDNYEYDLNTIYQPFIKWQYLYKGLVGNNILPDIKPLTIRNVVQPNYSKLPYNEQTLDQYDVFQALKLILLVFLFFTLFVCFGKAAFLDLIIICDFVILYEWNALTESKFFALTILTGLSILLDFPWLVMFSSDWISPPKDSTDRALQLDNSSNRFVALMVYFCLLIKIALCVCFYILSQKLKQTQQVQHKRSNDKIIKIDMQNSQADDNLYGSRLYISKGRPIEIQ